MMEEPTDTLPAPGDALIVLIPGERHHEFHPATLRFDRGRGLIVDVQAACGWRRGERVLLAFLGEQRLWWRPGVVGELVSARRAYVVPQAPWRAFERREHIRSMLHLPACVTIGETPSGSALVRSRIELSASGFRWFGAVAARPGDAVVLSVDLSQAGGSRADLRAQVVRVENRGAQVETAASFLGMPLPVLEQILSLVCRQRLVELGASLPDSDGCERPAG